MPNVTAMLKLQQQKNYNFIGKTKIARWRNKKKIGKNLLLPRIHDESYEQIFTV